MRGVYCDGRSARLRLDLPEPRPNPGEVIVQVRRAGICDTDLQLARGYMGFRGVLGHEFLGVLDDGTRVTAEINNACRRCEACRAGRMHHCPHRTVLGILGHDGAMADLVSVPEANIHPIPDSIDDRRAIFIEPLAAAFRIIEQLPAELLTDVAIIGDGKLGLLCAWALRTTGAAITLVGKHPDKLALAGEGLRTVVLDDAAKLGRAFEVVADCTGSTTGLPTALGLVRPLGTVVLKTTIAGEYAINLAPIVIDEITVLGSRCGPFPRAIAALASGEVDPTPLLGPEFPLDRAEEAFAAASARGARKVALVIGT
jgi:threonine dehydrogenase-like Zn-dependent dehydrogenase